MAEDPEGGIVFGDRSMATTDPGIATLPLTGTYTITVFGESGGTGTYQFQVLQVPPAQEFTINVGDVVSEGVPEPGAGNIESQGALDVYRFEGEEGQVLYFDSQERSTNLLHWRTEDPSGGVLFADRSMATFDPGVIELPLTGTYKITVFGESGGIGTYQFQALEVPPAQEFEISIGDVVPDDVIGDGAGSIESQGALDVYTFEGTAGQQVFFEQLSTANPSVRWKGEDPNGGVLFAEQSMATTDVGLRTLPLDGTYIITALGNQGATGMYRFQTFIVEP
jgi:hypothetical protein